MDIKELFKGVAVIIDDEVNKKDTQIFKIVKKLEEENVPLLKYKYLPDDKIVENFLNVSFILLDWQLDPIIDVETKGTVSGSTSIEIIKPSGGDNTKIVIDFIKKLTNKYFLPVFIFSKEYSDVIIQKLKEENLYIDEGKNFIFVKKKEELISDEENKIFTEIEKWLRETPSIYVLKEWEKSLNDAKNKLFWDFYNINHKWPSVLQKTFQDDGSDVNYELGNFIFKNIMARTEPIEFDEDILKIEDNNLTQEEIRNVLEAERFIKNDSLPSDIPFTGDLFKYRADGEDVDRYYLNIRPECDIARKSNPELYCIKGKIINEDSINSNNDDEISFKKGSFIEKANKTYAPFLVDGKIIEFTFNDIKIKKWNNIKNDRVGRILPPYITAIQQKYAFYLQRQGLPAIPEKAFKK